MARPYQPSVALEDHVATSNPLELSGTDHNQLLNNKELIMEYDQLLDEKELIADNNTIPEARTTCIHAWTLLGSTDLTAIKILDHLATVYAHEFVEHHKQIPIIKSSSVSFMDDLSNLLDKPHWRSS